MLNNKNLEKIKDSFDNDGYITLKNFFKKKKIKSVKKNLYYF